MNVLSTNERFHSLTESQIAAEFQLRVADGSLHRERENTEDRSYCLPKNFDVTKFFCYFIVSGCLDLVHYLESTDAKPDFHCAKSSRIKTSIAFYQLAR